MRIRVLQYGIRGFQKCAEAEVKGDETVADVARRCFPDFRANRFVINGEEVLDTDRVRDGLLVVWCVPQDPTQILIGLAITVILSAASYLIQKQMMKKAMKTKYGKDSEALSDTQYGWDYDAKNAVTEGSPVPVLYGKRMVTPPVAQSYSESVNLTGESFLYSTYALADGGAGFDDVITFPAGDDGSIYATIDHIPWRNFNNEPEDASDRHNYLYRNTTIYRGAHFNTSTGQIVDAHPVERANDGIIDEGFHQDGKLGEWGFQTKNAVTPTAIRIYSAYGYYQVNGFRFSAYNQNEEKWEVLGEANARYGSAPSVCSISFNFPNTRKWRLFRIDKMKWKPGSKKPNEDKSVTEIEMDVDLSSESSIPSGNLVALDVAPGTFWQAPPSFVDGTWASLAIEKKLDTNEFFFKTTPGAYPDRLAMQIQFPYGLYGIDEQTGNPTNKTVDLYAQFRGIKANGETGAWSDFFTSEHEDNDVVVSGGVASITKNAQSEISMTFIRKELNSGNLYDHFEVSLKFNEKPIVDVGEMADCVWSGLDEGWGFVPSYVRTATATMKMEASERVSGAAPQFRILVERPLVYVYNTITGTWEGMPASNPAWVAYDLIVRPRFNSSRYDAEEGQTTGQPNYTSPNDAGALMRETYDHEKMLYGEFKAWADFCDENSITCSLYYDSQITVAKALEYICDIGRAAIIMRGGMIGVSVDRRAIIDADGNISPVFKFDANNIVEGTWGVQWRDRYELPTEIEVTFFDKEREWNRFTVVAKDASADDENITPNVESLTLYACDSRAVAEAHAQFILKQNLIRKTYAWTGIMDSLPVDIGDVVQVYDDFVTVTAVTLNEDYTKKYEGVEYVDSRFA